MIIEEFSMNSVSQGKKLYGNIYLPSTSVKGIIQFAHGMNDYGSRYEPFFRFLNSFGYIVGYVDFLGHGLTAESGGEHGFFADSEGWKIICQDFAAFYDKLEKLYPGYRHYVMGHSLGSSVVRYFISEARKNPAGAIMIGATGPNYYMPIISAYCRALIMVKGPRYVSPSLEETFCRFLTHKLKNVETDYDWICSDPDMVESFYDDDMRNFTFTISGFHDVFKLTQYVNYSTEMEQIPKGLPMLFLSGGDDPVSDYGRGIQKICNTMEGMGFNRVKKKIYPGLRHELCQEVRNKEVYDDIIKWLRIIDKKEINLNYEDDDFLDY